MHGQFEVRAGFPYVKTAMAKQQAVPCQYFAVQERGRMSLVPMTEVLYLKAELKYVTLRTRHKQYLIEDSLVSIEEELTRHFVRVHRHALRCHAMRLKALSALRRQRQSDTDKPQEIWQVILRDTDHWLPISRRQLSEIKVLVC